MDSDLFTNTLIFYVLTVCFNNEKALLLFFTQIPQATLKTTGPNIGMFVLILMHFPC